MNNFTEYEVCEGLKHIRYDFIPTKLFMERSTYYLIKMKSESDLYQWK